jgi:uncharacterized protein (DUF488 family)
MPRRKAKDRTIFTVGHSTRSWPEFRDLLRANRIQRLVDVRTIPRSRHNPQFNRETLSKKLRAARIAYTHLPGLGGLRRASPDSPNKGWRNRSFRGYADYMQTPEFDEGLRRLMKLAANKTSAILCAEAVPWRCHRSLIADALSLRHIPVADIISGTSVRLHSLTSFAKVRGLKITYPAGPAAAGT